jgi:ribosomal protein S18 acetylase RimI-like enzyme
MSFRVIPFKPAYAPVFRDLNLEWLTTYFYVEEKDKELLENCEETIIKEGGFIFFAEWKGTLVGCYSLICMHTNIYELGKMAVDPNFQGLKIGQRLVSHAIAFAQANKWEKIILYSNTILGPAIYIYKKYGFKEIALEKDTPYKRSNIKMERILDSPLRTS